MVVKKQTRQERALATRRRMIEAAYRVFVQRGYAKTTMDAIAEEAGVAVQTLYFTFHTKGELLQAAFDYAVLGEDPTPPHLTTWHRAAEVEPDVAKAIALVVDGTIGIFERAAPLLRVVVADEDAREAYQHNENLRVEGYRRMIRFLADKRPLRKGLTVERAADVLLTLMGPEVFLALTQERGWTTKYYAGWLTDVLVRELFEPVPSRARRQA